MPKLLNFPRWNDILVEIKKNNEKNRYCERLNRKIKGSRSYIREVVKKLVKNNLIKIKPTRKIKWLELTDKGSRVTESIIQMRSELGYL